MPNYTLGGVLDPRRPTKFEKELASADSIKVVGGSSRGQGIGYGTGAGGAVTQITSKSTAVTLHKLCGTITTHAASLSAAAEVGFSVTNNMCAANDVPVVAIKSGATADSYQVSVDAVADGSFRITYSNVSSGALTDTIVFSFVIVKGAAA